MEISWKWLNLCLGLLFFQLCNGFPINVENSVADQHTQLLTGLVAVLLTICSVVLLAGCLCCQRRNGFKEFRDSPVVASAASNLDHGHVNPIANGEFTIFTPLSSSAYNNNVFLANERIITRTAEDFVYEDFDVSSWFSESEKDFPRIKLKYIKELGKGWFGKVVEGAAKEIPPNEQSWTPVVVRILETSASRKERVLFLHDAAIYRCGSHPNLLSLIGRCLDTVPLLLLQECCPQGDLKSYLRSKKENIEQLFSTDYPLLWCCQLTSALKHLHNHGVTHPDFATRNCQLAFDLTLKVGDYGLSESKYPEDYYQGSPTVPVRWCSPESLTCTLTTIQPKKTTVGSNVWSLGVTIWEICECGEQPYSTLSDDEVVSQVLGPPNIRLSRPKFPVLYTDYLYRLMQSCWTNSESRPSVFQIDLMLSDLWQVYKNTKTSSLSAYDFDKRWESFKPNSLIKNDSMANGSVMDELGANITKPLSPSLNNLHGSLDNLLNSGDQMELCLDNADLPFVKSGSNMVLSLDDPFVSEISSSDSGEGASPKQKKSKLKSKIDFDLNVKFRDSNFKHPYNFSDSALFSQRTTSSESETEDENWRKKVERGAYTEKVRLKSRSVADLMILTHVDYSESESETPLPSLDYRVNYKNVRYAPKNNLENVGLTYGSEGNLLSVHDTFQEELKKLKEERRDSLLFVPDNHSQTSSNKLDNSNHNFSVEELTLNDSNLDNVIDSTNKRLMHELNNVAEIQPANQIFNVFSVTIDKFKPIHVNSCKFNDIINFSDIDDCCSFEQEEKMEALESAEKHKEESIQESRLEEIGFCDTNEKHISDHNTYQCIPRENNFQNKQSESNLNDLLKEGSTSNDHICQINIHQNHNGEESNNPPVFINENDYCLDAEEKAVTKLHSDLFSRKRKKREVEAINPIFFNDTIIPGLEVELSSSTIGNKDKVVSQTSVIHRNDFMDSTNNYMDFNSKSCEDIERSTDNNLQLKELTESIQEANFDSSKSLADHVNLKTNSNINRNECVESESKFPDLSAVKQGVSDADMNTNDVLVEDRVKMEIPKLSEIIKCKKYKVLDEIDDNNLSTNLVFKQFSDFKELEIPEIIDLNENALIGVKLQDTNISQNSIKHNSDYADQHFASEKSNNSENNIFPCIDDAKNANEMANKSDEIIPEQKSENKNVEGDTNHDEVVLVEEIEKSICESEVFINDKNSRIRSETEDISESINLLDTQNISVDDEVNIKNIVINSVDNLNHKEQETFENNCIPDLDQKILEDLNQSSKTEDKLQIPKLSEIILSSQQICGFEFRHPKDIDGIEKELPSSAINQAFIVPKLSEIINKNIISKCLEGDQINLSKLSIDTEEKSCEQQESHSLNSKDILESKNISDGVTEVNKSENTVVTSKPAAVTFDLSGDQEQVPNALTHVNVFTSTPASRNHKHHIPSEKAYSSLNLFGVGEEKEEASKKLDIHADLVPLDTSKDLNYSLETWDNFLGKTLDAQNDVQTENMFDSFSSEPHSLLFVENGNDLVQSRECIEEDKDNKQVVKSSESNQNNETFVIDTKNEKTFVIDDGELVNKNETFTLNKTNSVESETEDTVDNSAWGSGGGWFLHPQTNNKEPSGTIDIRENTDSYVGFGIDDEIMTAIRNELLTKLPHAQVAPSEKVTEAEEWDSNDKNEVFLKYNIYNPPLSPILEESYFDESDIITPKQESDNEDSEWSEHVCLPETLLPELESQSAHTYDSQLKGPHHQHTPSQDSCCSNDTLFNLEELTCVTGDVEKENDTPRNEVHGTNLAEFDDVRELEKNGSIEITLQENCTETDLLNPVNVTPVDIREVSRKSENNNNINDKDLNSSSAIEGVVYNVEEIKDVEQKEDVKINYKNQSISTEDNEDINLTKPANSDCINLFISHEIEHNLKQYCRLNEGFNSESNSSTDESPIVFKRTQVGPLPSPEDNPWKQLPASLLSYDKVISQNNTLLLPAKESNDVVPELNDLPNDKDTAESQYKSMNEFSEECIEKCEDNKDPNYENYNIKDSNPVYENLKEEQPAYENDNTNEKELIYENTKEAQPVYENVNDVQPVYQNFNVSSDIYNEADYVNIVNLENNKNNAEYVNDKREYISIDSDHSENKIVSENSHDEDIYGMLTDIKFNGPSENHLTSTSFSESNEINDEQDWDSGSDTRSSSSGEFIWKEGEHEESLKALRAAPQDVLEDIKPMEGIAEESTDESDVSSTTSDEEGEVPEFVPSAWDKFATPTKSALRSPEKTLEKSEKNKSKGVWFKKQKYHCVYEYPREPDSPILQSQDLWKPQLDYNSFTDWEFDADTYFPSAGDDNDIFPSAYNYQPKSPSSRNLYQLTSISDLVPSNSGLDDEFYISSSTRPFDVIGGLSSQFFPGSVNWTGENVTPDSGMEDGTPGSSTEVTECTDDMKINSHLIPSLKKLASDAVKSSKQTCSKSNDGFGGLRHTRNKLKLDLPPSPSAFTSTKMFTVEPTLEPVIREKPTFTTFGKSRFSVQHVDTPPEESENKNVSFEALPYKPMKEDTVKVDSLKESCQEIDHEKYFKHKFECSKGHEFTKGEASLLDSADEDSGIESSTLERKLSNDGLLQ